MVPVLAAVELWSPAWFDGLIATAVYAVFGMLLFGASIWIMERLAPFSLRKELEEDQNTALAILMGSIVIGIAIIFAASIAS